MTRRAVHTVTNPDGSTTPYTMRNVWQIGEVVEVAGTKYRVEESGWRKVK